MNIIYSTLTSLIFLVPGLYATNQSIFEPQLSARVMQEPSEQLYQIYSNSSFASSSFEIQKAIEKLEALFLAFPEMKTTKVRGQGDLTGEKLLANLKEKLAKIQKEEVQRRIDISLEKYTIKFQDAYSYVSASSLASVTIKQASDTYKQVLVDMTNVVAELKEFFVQYPDAKTTQIRVPNKPPFDKNLITGQELQTIIEKFIVQATTDQKAIREKIMTELRNDAKAYETVRPLALLQVSRQQAVSTNIVARRSAGFSYQSTISQLTSFIEGLNKLIAQDSDFVTEMLTIEGKKQTVADHLQLWQQTLVVAKSEFAAFKPKWQAVIAEFDKKTKTLLAKLLVGDRKSVYNSRGWTSRFPGYSDNLDPTQVVNAFVKASSWKYIIDRTDRPTCTYDYFFQGNKLVRAEKEPAAFC
jgi:hypothetical protein